MKKKQLPKRNQENFEKTVKFLALNYFLEKDLSWIFDMVLNTPQSYYDSICYYNTYDNQKQPPEVFCKKGVLRNFVKFTGKHLCQVLFYNKVAGPKSETLAQVFSY